MLPAADQVYTIVPVQRWTSPVDPSRGGRAPLRESIRRHALFITRRQVRMLHSIVGVASGVDHSR